MPTKNIEDALEFRDLQRARRLMPRARLAAELARERGYSERELFGVDLMRAPDLPEVRRLKESCRFPDELTALRMYVRAALVLQNGGSSMAGLADREGSLAAAAGSRRPRNGTIKIRATKRRNSIDPARERSLADFVDIGTRLDDLEWTKVEMLVRYYVQRCSARELAEELGTCPMGIGGHISQARRALRKALVGLIPSRERVVECTERACMDKLAVRRAKVARFLHKRITGGEPEEVVS